MAWGQPEDGYGLAWSFLPVGCSVGMCPCRVALASGCLLSVWIKPQFNGTMVSEMGDFIQGLPQASISSQMKGEGFSLGKATEVTCWLGWVCPNISLTDKHCSSHTATCGERHRAGRSRAKHHRFLHRQLLFPPDNRGAENMQHPGSLFIIRIPQYTHRCKAVPGYLARFVYTFEKCTLCLLGVMFLNVSFSVLSESYSHHSYTSQYFLIAIVTACDEGTAK